MRTRLPLAAVILVGLATTSAGQPQFVEMGNRLPADDDDTYALALGDVDGDNDLDIVVANTIGFSGRRPQNRLYLNDGTGAFTDATSRLPQGPDATLAVALGDVDGDGDLDIVFGNDGQNRLYSNDGTGTFSNVTSARMPADSDCTSAVALGDVDCDGDLDIVVGNSGYSLSPAGRNRLYLNDGNGMFTDVSAARMPVDSEETLAVALGDADGDGDLDIVFGNILRCPWYFLCFGSGQNQLYLNDGTGTYTDATVTHMPARTDDTLAVALGDVDGDGDLDAVFGNTSGYLGPQNRLCLNDGSGRYTDALLPWDGDFTKAAALGDVDDDGDLDILLGNRWSQNRLYLNEGNGRFLDFTAALLPLVADDRTEAVALGDVDGDGDLDMVLGNDGQQNRLYLNLLRQLVVPSPTVLGGTYQLDVYARRGWPQPWLRQSGAAALFVATGTAQVPLPPLGTFGLDPSQTVALPPVSIPQPAGVTSVVLAVPNATSLIGVALYAQALVAQPPAPARLTNVTADIVQ